MPMAFSLSYALAHNSRCTISTAYLFPRRKYLYVLLINNVYRVIHDIDINAYKCYFLQKLFDGMHELEGSIIKFLKDSTTPKFTLLSLM